MRQRYSVLKWRKAGRGLGTRLVTQVFFPSSLSLIPPFPFFSLPPPQTGSTCSLRWWTLSGCSLPGQPSGESPPSQKVRHHVTYRPKVQLHSTPWHHGGIMVTSWDIMVTYWPDASTTDLWTVELKWLPLTVQLRYVCACVLERVGVLCGWFGSMHAV